jgi:hypothetical protein
MPVFMIERQYAEALDPSIDGVTLINEINADENVRWLYSFLSADRMRSFCLYEAESAEAIRRAASRSGLPADLVIEVQHTVHPDASMVPILESVGR